MHDHHHHHHAPSPDEAKSKAFLFAAALNAAFVAAEFAAGFFYNSMGLLADAGHNLGDVGGLLLSLGGFFLSRKRSARNYTYGFRKATVLASLANAVILLLAVGAIVLECVRKFRHPEPVAGVPIIVTAAIGVFINGITAFLFLKDKEHDLNVKGAYIHMLADTLVSVGVVFSGVLILWTGWSVVDPVIGLAVATAILFSTWGLLRESVRLSLDGVPTGIDPEELKGHLLAVAGVNDVHHLHVWPLSTTENALTAHVRIADLAELETVKQALRRELAEHGVAHSTLEFEAADCVCKDTGKR